MNEAATEAPFRRRSQRRRLAIVLSHPNQYYSPWFAWMARETDLDLRVFYLWDFGIKPQLDPRFQKSFAWDVDLVSGYDWELVPNRSGNPGTESFLGLRNPGLTRRVRRWKPDAVLLFGYAYLSHLSLILGCRMHGIPLLFRGDSHFLGRPQLPVVKKWSLRLLYRQFAGFACVGKANRDYFLACGADLDRLRWVPHSVNLSLFDPHLPEHIEEASALRASLKLPEGERLLLFSGKFQEEKDPLGLLGAFEAAQLARTTLVFSGDGPLRPHLERACHGRRNLRLLPFANQSAMPARYLAADLFCLPSKGLHETWGLSVNEAMHMGLPCLVSDRVGCQQDLVEDSVTGWVFKAGDYEQLRTRLQTALGSDLKQLGGQARQRIAGFSYRESTKGLLELLDLLHP